MFKKNKHLQSGFTLVEVLVVIGILGMLMAFAIPSEISYRQKSELKQSVKELRSLYWEAQGLSQAPRTKDVVSYALAIAKQTDPISAPLVSKECLDASTGGCNTEFNRVYLGKNIYISDMICFTESSNYSLDTLATYFLVSEENKSSGTISFRDTIGSSSELDCQRVEIEMSSKLFNTLKYKIILDKVNGAINYSLK